MSVTERAILFGVLALFASFLLATAGEPSSGWLWCNVLSLCPS